MYMFYVAQYPVSWTAQSAAQLHFTAWQTCSLWHDELDFSGKHSSHAAITREDYSLT